MIGKEEFCNKIKQCEVSMYYLAQSIVNDKEDASDVVNESILKAYEKLEHLKNEELFKTWILRIVHNTAIEMIRKNKKMLEKQTYREVKILFYYENLSVEEISQITNTNILTVRKQLSMVRKQLKELLKEA